MQIHTEDNCLFDLELYQQLVSHEFDYIKKKEKTHCLSVVSCINIICYVIQVGSPLDLIRSLSFLFG